MHLFLIDYLVTSSAFWTFACTDPNKSAPIFFSSCVSNTNSQSCRSSLWTWMKSTRVSKNMLNTYSSPPPQKKKDRREERKKKRKAGKKRSWCRSVLNSQKNNVVTYTEADRGNNRQPSRKSFGPVFHQNVRFKKSNLYAILKISTSCSITESRNAVVTGATIFI